MTCKIQQTKNLLSDRGKKLPRDKWKKEKVKRGEYETVTMTGRDWTPVNVERMEKRLTMRED